MRRYKSTFEIFSGFEHRMRKEEMEEQVNKEAKQGWRFPSDAARIIDGNAISTRREESSLLPTAIREQKFAKKMEWLSQSQAMREELPRHG